MFQTHALFVSRQFVAQTLEFLADLRILSMHLCYFKAKWRSVNILQYVVQKLETREELLPVTVFLRYSHTEEKSKGVCELFHMDPA